MILRAGSVTAALLLPSRASIGRNSGRFTGIFPTNRTPSPSESWIAPRAEPGEMSPARHAHWAKSRAGRMADDRLTAEQSADQISSFRSENAKWPRKRRAAAASLPARGASNLKLFQASVEKSSETWRPLPAPVAAARDADDSAARRTHAHYSRRPGGCESIGPPAERRR
jgi:hypothetical protein